MIADSNRWRLRHEMAAPDAETSGVSAVFMCSPVVRYRPIDVDGKCFGRERAIARAAELVDDD